jgi:hypothetical protein
MTNDTATANDSAMNFQGLFFSFATAETWDMRVSGDEIALPIFMAFQS